MEQIPLGKVSRCGGCSNLGDLRAVLAFMAQFYALFFVVAVVISLLMFTAFYGVFSSVCDSMWKRSAAAAARASSLRASVQSWSCRSCKGSVCRR